VEQFAVALLDGTAHDISGEDGRAAIEMCEAAIRSNQTGAAVAIPMPGA
jgi:predicted dehydrogenase